MTRTNILPPAHAIRMAWALTGHFNTVENSKICATRTELIISDIKNKVKDKPQEQEYVENVIAAIYANVRSLDVIYKGRNLNFEENEKLRKTYLEAIKENIDYGTKIKDYLKSIPSMVVGGAGGVTIAQYYGLSDIAIASIGLVFAGVSYPFYRVYLKQKKKEKLMNYVNQDYERNLYFEQYVDNVKTVLNSLNNDLNRIHEDIFNNTYQPTMSQSIEECDEVIDRIINGIKSKYCEKLHAHKRADIITPELWSYCESGNITAKKLCPYWDK